MNNTSLSLLKEVNIEENAMYSILDIVIDNRGKIEVLEKLTGRQVFLSDHPKERHHLIIQRIKLQLISKGDDFVKYIKSTQGE